MNNYGHDIQTDPQGNVFITGRIIGDSSFGHIELSSSWSDFSAFIAKLDTNGNFLWVKHAENSGGYSIITDNAGGSYIAGYFAGTTIFGDTQLDSFGGKDTFYAKYDSEGNILWVKQAGGTGEDICYGLAIDPFGNLYATGSFYNTPAFDMINLYSPGEQAIFIAKLSDYENIQFPVYLLSSPSHIGSELSGAGLYYPGSTISISAGNPGYAFTEWTGDPQDIALLDDPNSPAASFAMPDRTVVLTAVFVEADRVIMYRFFNYVRGGHLYTISEIERDYIIQNLPEWQYEGPKFEVYESQVHGSTATYRFFNTITGIHLYTISEHERDTVMQIPEWNYEGIKFYVHADNAPFTIPVFRFFNHVRGGHLYTISEDERDTVMQLPEWIYEGVPFYVLPLIL